MSLLPRAGRRSDDGLDPDGAPTRVCGRSAEGRVGVLGALWPWRQAGLGSR